MSRIYLLIFLFCFGNKVLYAQKDTITTPIDTTTFVYANVMYEKGMYDKSIHVYEELLKKNGPSATLFYNLGNCYYKTNKLGPSILNYERALLLDGRNEDIKYNLSLTNKRIRDKMDPINQSLVALWWTDFIRLFTVNAWAYLSILFLWLSLTAFIIFRLAGKRDFQKYGFYGLVLMLFVFLISVVSAFARNHYDDTHQFAIVMSPSSIIKSEPNESSTNMFLIHEGLKVQILGDDNLWTEVKMPDGNVGWLNKEDIIVVDSEI